MVQFVKMSGLGNDFVLVDAIKSGLEPNLAMIVAMADRHLGIGCDQVLWLSKTPQHFGYRIFNPDGSEVAQCGNGARCVGYYMSLAHGFDQWPLKLITCSDKILQVYSSDNNEYAVDMGAASAISAAISDQHLIAGLKFQAVDVGNPHAIFWQSPETFDFAKIDFKGHALFPDGVNVSAVQLESSSRVIARVLERGAGETMACGSAACAIVAAGFTQGILGSDVAVQMPGGVINVSYSKSSIKQTGGVALVFVGKWQQRANSPDMFYFGD